MNLIGILVALAVIGYTTYNYLGSSTVSQTDGIKTTPAVYIDNVQQSADSVNEILIKQKAQLDAVNNVNKN